MKTYAETQNEQPFDWNKFLDDAIKNEPHFLDKAMVQRLAASWVTCACGNMCDAIPRFSHEDLGQNIGCPKDGKLAGLGGAFYGEIYDEDWDSAKIVLSEIEKRSAELLAEMGVK